MGDQVTVFVRPQASRVAHHRVTHHPSPSLLTTTTLASYCDTRDVAPIKAAMFAFSLINSGTWTYIMCPAS